MSEKSKGGPPPYATYSSFISFINKLRDTAIPSRIDASVFGNASGSQTYSIIATLKFLKLIDSNGAPLPALAKLVTADDEDRKAQMATLIKDGYPSFFTEIDLEKATSGQFDEHIRETFDSSGSTVDKIAGFFIAAATYAGISMSPLIKARKLVATSPAAGKSKKQRKASSDGDDDENPPYIPPTPAEVKALEYQLIDLMKTPGIGAEEQAAIWKLVQFLTTSKKAGG